MSNALSPASKPYVELGKALGALAAALLGQVNSQTQACLATQGTEINFYVFINYLEVFKNFSNFECTSVVVFQEALLKRRDLT